MKKIITAASIATLLTAGSFAVAQDAAVGVDANAGVSAETPAGDVSVGTDASAGASANASTDMGNSDNTYGSVISSINAGATTDFSTITDEAKVTIVLLSSLQGDAATESAALDEALSAHADAHTALHSSIDGNATIKAKLEAEGYASSDVVAVKSNADGSIVLYVDDRA